MFTILFRVGFSGASTADSALIALLEGEGHTVDTITATTVPDFEGYDLGIVGPQSGQNMTDSRQTWLESPVPVLWMDPGNTTTAGFASGAAGTISSQTTLTVPVGAGTHALVTAAGLEEGSNTIQSSGGLHYIQSVLAAGVVLGTVSGAFSARKVLVEFAAGTTVSGFDLLARHIWLGFAVPQNLNALGETVALETVQRLGAAGGGEGGGSARGRDRGRGAGRNSSTAALFA